MIFSTNWIKEFFKTTASPDEIARVISKGLVQIDRVEPVFRNLQPVVVGLVKDVRKHPNADTLSVASVDIGKKKLLTIVCGADNLKKGQKVPVIPAGGTLALNGKETKIFERDIRNIKSQGMICSEKELGLGSNESGIMVLPFESKVGQSLRTALGCDDAIFEIENASITHRGDLWSHIGISRECGVLFHKSVRVAASKPVRGVKKKSLDVTVVDPRLCPRYMAVVIDGVRNFPSPPWMANRLEACGIRAQNILIDITNYVMLEWGQPLHGFDCCSVAQSNAIPKIIVRRAKNNESLEALDGQILKLDPSMLVIADQNKPIAVAGVIGGKETGIFPSTTKVILESAFFDPISIRKTSQALSRRTDSAMRFEKQLSPFITEIAFARAAALFTSLAGGRVVSQVVDRISPALKRMMKKKHSIEVPWDEVSKISGIPFSKKTISSILKRLYCDVTNRKSSFIVTPPHFRPDIRNPEDVIEEIVRVHGVEHIPETPLVGQIDPIVPEKTQAARSMLSNLLNGFGMDEVSSYSFYSETIAQQAGFSVEDHIRLKNPLSKDLTLLRRSLIPGLLTVFEKNEKRIKTIQCFETGHVFCPMKKGEKNGCRESVSLGCVISSSKDPACFFQLKGIVDAIMRRLHISFEWKKFSHSNPPAFCHPQYGLAVQVSGQIIGHLCLVDPSVLSKFGISSFIASLDIDIEQFALARRQDWTISPIPTYPSVFLDIAVTIDEKIEWQAVEKELQSGQFPLLRSYELFDVYRGNQIPKHEKSFALHFEFSSNGRTLSLPEAERERDRILSALHQSFNAILRT